MSGSVSNYRPGVSASEIPTAGEFLGNSAFPFEPFCLSSWAAAQVNFPLLDAPWVAPLGGAFELGAFRSSFSPFPEPALGRFGGVEYVPPGWQSMEEQRARKALAEANLSGPGLISAITKKVHGLHIAEQQRFIGKIVAILSSSILGPPQAGLVSSSRRLKQRQAGAVKATRQSPRLQHLRSILSSSRWAQAEISVRLGFINRPEEFCDDTLLTYLHFFHAPMPDENVAKLAEIAGLSSPSHLRLPDSKLQAVLEELAGHAI
ncbi:hypothetical protein D1007_20608 [Hordeum vulgare]|nr:hypothetical protein D1007_20608 [Hordeum vulgare]